jgi:hypothetical protein
MTDIVTRLRQAQRQYVDNEYNLHARAADRIEALEEALREIVEMTPDPEFGTPPLETAKAIARKAL